MPRQLRLLPPCDQYAPDSFKILSQLHLSTIMRRLTSNTSAVRESVLILVTKIPFVDY